MGHRQLRMWCLAATAMLAAGGSGLRAADPAPTTAPATSTAPAGGGAYGERGARGPAVTVLPLASAVAVDKVPPLDEDANFKVTPSGPWTEMPILTVKEGVARGTVGEAMEWGVEDV